MAATRSKRARKTANGGPPRVGRRPGRPATPTVPAPVAAATARFWQGLSQLRRARFFHPTGVAYAATLAVGPPGPEHAGASLLDEEREHPAIVRFSRATGVPEPLPDVLGLAVSITDVYGRGRHQDLLLATSGTAPGLRHVLLPAPAGFFGPTLSSILLYRIGDRVRVVCARSASEPERTRRGALAQLVDTAERGDLTFRIAVASLTGAPEPLAELRVGRRLPDELAERIAFNPWNTGGGIAPVGPLMGLRRAAYRGSQRGRGLTEAEIP